MIRSIDPIARLPRPVQGPQRCGLKCLLKITSAVLCWGLLAVAWEQVAAQESGNTEIDPVDATESEEKPEFTRDDVLDLVDRLDARKAAERAAAERDLIELGPEAVPFLPQSRSDFSIEASERLARVRAALQMQKTKVQAKPVRINLAEATTLGTALEIISRESGVEFEHTFDESMPVQTNSTPLSFWNAVDLVLDQCDLDVNAYAGEKGSLALMSRQEGRPSRVNSAAYSGVYRLEPLSATARRVLNAPDQSGLNLAIELRWQPGRTPIGVTIPISKLSGEFDSGKSLTAQTTEQTIDIAANAELASSEFYLPFELPAESPDTIRALRGTIESLLPGNRHQYKLDLTKVGEEEKVESVAVKLERVEPNGALYEIRFGVSIDDAGRSLESHRQWIFQNPVYIVDHQGERIENLGY
ncbi:MAG: hypothetical protein AAF802_20460, partial [Planctomycetota bacterium]